MYGLKKAKKQNNIMVINEVSYRKTNMTWIICIHNWFLFTKIKLIFYLLYF